MRRAVAASCRRAAAANSLGQDQRCLATASGSLWLRGADSSSCTAPQPAAGPFTRWDNSCGARGFAADAVDEDGDEKRDVYKRASPKVKQLAEEILNMSLLDVSDLTDILKDRLGVSGMPIMGMGGGGGMAAPAPEGTAAPPAAAAPAAEKTEFDIKLTGYEAASKVKVIKEVRTMTSLGLKEAKELVEKAPTVIKAGVKKEEAEELQKKLEAVGGKIALE